MALKHEAVSSSPALPGLTCVAVMCSAEEDFTAAEEHYTLTADLGRRLAVCSVHGEGGAGLRSGRLVQGPVCVQLTMMFLEPPSTTGEPIPASNSFPPRAAHQGCQIGDF
jgi:hypothetical protein